MSCSHDKIILDTVPAESPAVVVLNTKSLEQALIDKSSSTYSKASVTLERLLAKSDDATRSCLNTLLLSDVVADDMLVAYARSEGVKGLFSNANYYAVTFYINDESRLKRELKVGDAYKKGDFNVYAICNNTMSLLTRENQGWIIANADKDKAAESINSDLNDAKKNPVTSKKSLRKFFESEASDYFAKMIFIDKTGYIAPDGWLCCTIDFDRNYTELNANVKAIDKSGNEIELDKSLAKVDSKMLKYLAPTDMFACAIGVPSDMKSESLLSILKSCFGFNMQQKAMAALLMPYLKRIDGTIFIAAGLPGNGAVSENDVSFFVGIQMKKGEAENILKDFSDVMSMLGVRFTKDGDKYVIPSSSATPITVQVVDKKCLVVTNRSLAQSGNSVAEKALKDNAAALWCDLPGSVCRDLFDVPGFKLTLGVKKDAKAEFSFTDSNMPLLVRLADTVYSAATPLPDESDDFTYGFTPIDTIQ
jgi:hypothetical protein